MAEHRPWQHRGDDPPRWVTHRGGEFWYLRMIHEIMGDSYGVYRLSSNGMDDKTIKARTAVIAQNVADTIITAVLSDRERAREYAEDNRVWVVSYKDPHDSTYPGVWGVYRTRQGAEEAAAVCENAEWINVLITDRMLDEPGKRNGCICEHGQ